MKTLEPFPAVTCQRIRNLQARVRDAEKRRQKAFTTRDQLKNRIAQQYEGDDIEHLKAQRNDAIDEIEALKAEISWLQSEIADTVENADEPDLFDSAELEVPDFKAKLDEKAAKAAEKASKGAKEKEPEPEPEDPTQTSMDYENAAAAAGGNSGPEDDARPYGMKPGKWEIQKTGQRGRGKQRDIRSATEADAVLEEFLPDEFDPDSVSVNIGEGGESGTVSVGDEDTLTLIRRGDAEPLPEPAKPSIQKPNPKWGDARDEEDGEAA